MFYLSLIEILGILSYRVLYVVIIISTGRNEGNNIILKCKSAEFKTSYISV